MAQHISKPYAVFDIDGTIVRWQLYHAINDVLAKNNVINQDEFNSVRQARMNWKIRKGHTSYKEYESQLVRLFEKELKGLKVSDLEAAADTVFNVYKDQVYTFTRDLISELKSKGYLLFAISGSPEIIVKKLATYYGFDDYAATSYEQIDGFFTGKKNLTLGKKSALLQALISKHKASNSLSFGVGDSAADSDMLAYVDHPIAFNPSSALLTIARDSYWDIVVERKDVIYKLIHKDGAYILEDYL